MDNDGISFLQKTKQNKKQTWPLPTNKKKEKEKKNNPTKNGLSYSKWLSWLKIFQY